MNILTQKMNQKFLVYISDFILKAKEIIDNNY